MIRSRLLFAIFCLAAVQAGAQSLAPPKASERPAQKNERETSVPKEYLPPPGMCRIWVDNVPASRQPAPTDCTTAIRNRPPNARVVFGPGRTKDGKSAEKGRARPDTLPRRKPPG
jgi:hypothetical protein